MPGASCALALAVLMGCAGASAAVGSEPGVRVLVVYHSESGSTRAMAEAVARGAGAVSGVEVELRTVDQASREEVLGADAIVLGTPVFNANVSPEVQEFINGWPFEGAPLKNKIGAAFVSAGGISAGEEAAQLSLLRSMLVFGMVVVGGEDWRSAFGASAVVDEPPWTGPPPARAFTAKAEALGRRVAELASRWRQGRALGQPPERSEPE